MTLQNHTNNKFLFVMRNSRTALPLHTRIKTNPKTNMAMAITIIMLGALIRYMGGYVFGCLGKRKEKVKWRNIGVVNK